MAKHKRKSKRKNGRQMSLDEYVSTHPRPIALVKVPRAHVVKREHTAIEKRQAKHIAASERARGVTKKRAKSIAWATVNKQRKRKVRAMPAKGKVPPHLRKFLFKKGHGAMAKKKHHKKHHTAMTHHTAKPIIKYRTREVVRYKKRKHHGGHIGHRAAHGAGGIVPPAFKLKSAGIAGLIGYSEAGKGFATLKETLDKLPAMGKVPSEIVAGMIANYFSDRSEWVDAAATAFLDVGGYKLGQAGFSVSGDDD